MGETIYKGDDGSETVLDTDDGPNPILSGTCPHCGGSLKITIPRHFEDFDLTEVKEK